MGMRKRILALLLVLAMTVGLAACGASANAIATVVNGNKKQNVETVEELVAAIDASGNTVVTLLKDVSHPKNLILPYSCTIDFNGHSFSGNPQQGVGIIVDEAGGENPATTLKNGTLNSYADGIRVKGGAVVLSDMLFNTAFGNCVGLYDTNEAYKDMNKIENCTLVSDTYGCLSYNETDGDFSETGITITNTKLIAANPEGAAIFSKLGEVTLAGRVILGEGTQLYSYADIVAGKEMLFEGSGMAKTADGEVTVGDKTYTGIHQWTRDTENKVLDVLMIGNSFCWYFTEELHGVANAAGVQMNVNNLYYAGCSVQRHWESLQSNSADYEQYWITNDLGRFQHPDNLGIANALAYDQWDVITLQQHFSVSRAATYEKAMESCTPYVKNIYDHIKKSNPDAKLYWHETWAYAVGYPADKPEKQVTSVAVQTNQYNQIKAVSQVLCQENGVDMIPSGDAWQIARANPAVGDKLTRLDLYHDGDTGGGQYLNACVWFEVLTGKSCIGNTYRPDNYKLDEAKVANLQNAAHEAVAAIYGADYAK